VGFQAVRALEAAILHRFRIKVDTMSQIELVDPAAYALVTLLGIQENAPVAAYRDSLGPDGPDALGFY
jgi:hypothetical protein